MNFSDALTILGVSRDADSAQVRRAYLRLIKKHSPERDPEGFQRIREAYDVAQRFGGWFRGTSDVTSLATPAITVVAPTGQDAIEAASPELAIEPAHPPTPLDPLAELRVQLEQTHHHGVAMQLARDAARKHNTPEAYDLWFSTVDDMEHDQEAENVLREAIARGHQRFVAILRDRFSDSLTVPELRSWADDPSARDDYANIASALLGRGEAEHAATVMAAGLDRFADAPFATPPSFWHLHHLVLGLLAADHGDAASNLFARYCEVVPAGERGDAVRLASMAELLAVRASLDPIVIREVARALQAGDPSEADLELQAWAVGHPRAAKRTLKTLTAEAPMLANFYRDALVKPRFARPRFEFGFSNWWLGIVLLNAIRIVGTHTCDRSDTPRSYAREVPVNAPISNKQLEELQNFQKLDFLCTLNDVALCDAVRSWKSAVGCADKQAAAFKLEQAYAACAAAQQLQDTTRMTFVQTHTNSLCTGDSAGGSTP